jgi:hypothetical protein
VAKGNAALQAAEKRAEATSKALWGVDTTRRHNKSLWSRSIWNLFFRSPFSRYVQLR